MKRLTNPRSGFAGVLLLLGLAACGQSPDDGNRSFLAWAETPPMGWNSWDCFATTVTEAQTKAQTDYMAEHLESHGWEYIVVDIQWYEPGANSYNYRRHASLTMDEWGRLWPATNRFPSAANGVGFKALSDYVHNKGLKFGIHLMRGIPRQAVRANTLVQGTDYRARDIANTNSICPWNPDMYGVDMSRPGAQAYYNSVFDLIASWGVDYVKVDDISRPYQEHEREIEAVRKAIDHTGRPMVLSLSPGETPLTAGEHVMHHANLWRISDDFWDNWPALYEQFERLRRWTPYRGPGHWPDADMLPLGVIDLGRRSTRFTPDEQYTLMTLWCIARSPLMYGGDMTKMDDFTLSLLTNDEVLAVNQQSTDNHQLFRHNNMIGWIADVPGSDAKYLALFNAASAPALAAPVPVEIADLGFAGPVQVRDLWKHEDLGSYSDLFAPKLALHGAGLYRLSPNVKPQARAAGHKPTLFLIGDSTVRNGSGRGDGGLYGWGQVVGKRFDSSRINLENRARGGRSSRTYLTEGLWEAVLAEVRPGDFLMMQFGHNDGGPMDEGRARASIKGVGDESQVITNKNNGAVETVYTYGWYLRKYIADTKAKGATPIVLSPVPRNIWKEGRVVRASANYGKWAAAAAQKGGADFIDLNELAARRYEAAGQQKVAADYFTPSDHTHTTLEGARVNADAVVEGVEQLAGCPLRDYLAGPASAERP